MTYRKRKKRRKRKTRLIAKLRKPLIGFGVLLLISIFGYGGYDYYQNGNIDRTLELINQVRDYLEGLPEKAERLIKEAERLAEPYLLNTENQETTVFSIDDIPSYSGESYVVVNDNVPDFNDDERSSGAFEYYSEMDSLGRCRMAEAMITTEIMPTEERGQIGMVKPSGWHTVKYDNIDGRYLYNRCHLIAYELAGENANEKNLITGTRYMNVTGMLPWENMVTQYVKRTNDKVIYRVTPVFKGDELVARGVHMEAESIGSDEICFNIFVYNVQPGIGIDYSNGDSWQE